MLRANRPALSQPDRRALPPRRNYLCGPERGGKPPCPSHPRVGRAGRRPRGAADAAGSPHLYRHARTEIGHLAHITFARDAEVGEGHLPLGRPCDGVDLRILDDEGRDCAPGRVGTISVRLPFLAAGYWRDPTLTAK